MTEECQPTARILDGNAASGAIIERVRESIEQHVDAGGRRPGLAVVLVGADPASQIYVRAKRRDCERAGIHARDFDLPATTTQSDLLDLIGRLNDDPEIDGILVQLPLPDQIDEVAITNSINADKDVDGFHAFNVGRLALRQPGLRPCTRATRRTTLRFSHSTNSASRIGFGAKAVRIAARRATVRISATQASSSGPITSRS